jgi:amidase
VSSTPLFFQTIDQIADGLRSGEFGTVELTTMMLERIEEVDSHWRSYATVTPERALRKAEKAESELRSGADRGPLHGIPVAVKDLCFTRGVRTMGGTGVLADHVPETDATVVSRLEGAGAVLLGKLNLTEGAMGGYHPDFAIPVNPWAADRWSGASSSGSGVATAVGLCFASLGSDTGGSIRFPAAACGVTGLKPTWGRVSRYGVLPLAESLDHVGPLTRTTRDCALVLQALSGADPRDPTCLTEPVPDAPRQGEQRIKRVRIGLDERWVTHDVDPEVARGVLDAVAVLDGLGADIVQVSLPDMDPFVAAWAVLCSAEAVVAHKVTYPARRDEYGPYFRGWLDMGSGVSGADYARAHHLRIACAGHLRAVFTGIDLLACPSMPMVPQRVTPEELYGPMRERKPRNQRFTAPFDYNGAPTLSVPCGFSGEGMPLSLQLVARHMEESLLCRVGMAYQEATDWHLRHPAL